MTGHHRTRGGQPRLSGALRCFGAPQASPELVCCLYAAPSPPAACILLWTACRPGDSGCSSRQGAAQVAGVAAQSHEQPTKGDVHLAGAPGGRGRGQGWLRASKRHARPRERVVGHAHSLLGLLLLPLVYLAVHRVLVLVEQRRLITLVVGACSCRCGRVERGAKAELGAIGVPCGARGVCRVCCL